MKPLCILPILAPVDDNCADLTVTTGLHWICLEGHDGNTPSCLALCDCGESPGHKKRWQRANDWPFSLLSYLSFVCCFILLCVLCRLPAYLPWRLTEDCSLAIMHISISSLTPMQCWPMRDQQTYIEYDIAHLPKGMELLLETLIINMSQHRT